MKTLLAGRRRFTIQTPERIIGQRLQASTFAVSENK